MTKKAATNDLGLPLVKQTIIQKNLKCDFTDKEVKSLRSSLDQATMELDNIDDQKKAKKTEVEAITDKIVKGYEYRVIDCEVFMNVPNTGRKQVVRKDTNEVVEELDMTDEDLQLDLPFK